MDEAVVRWLMQPESLRLEPPPLEELLRRPAWHVEAACRGADVDLFFPTRGADRLAEARALCDGCSVRQACLDAALAEDHAAGIWGGLTERQRAQLRREAG